MRPEQIWVHNENIAVEIERERERDVTTLSANHLARSCIATACYIL